MSEADVEREVGQRAIVRSGAPATDTPRERADIRAAAPRRTLEVAVAAAVGVALFVLFTALVLSGL